MERRIYVFRTGCVIASLFIAFLFLARHLYTLQIIEHDRLYSKAKSTYTVSKTWSGKRGMIYDRNGNSLTGNIECNDILADLHLMPKDRRIRQNIIATLSPLLDLDPSILAGRFSSQKREIVIKNQVDRALARKIKALKLPGIRFVDDQKRYYPKGKLLANLLGFTDQNNNGVYGLESAWNEELSPKGMRKSYERDRKGHLINYQSSTTGRGVNGKSVYLTIDEPIQHFVEMELQKLAEEFAPKMSYAIMIDPKTGGIMAFAQNPSFNPNDRKSMNPEYWRNHILSDVYDPVLL